MLKRLLLSALALVVLGLALGAYYLLATYETPPVDPAWAVEPSATIPEGSVTVRFTGTSTLLFSDGVTSWMVDGWFSRFGLSKMLRGEIGPDVEAIEVGLARNEVDRLAAVIPVHSHFDHAMDAPEVARRTGAILLGSESTANIGRGWGLAESQIRVAVDRQPVQFGDFTITLIETNHFEFPDPAMREQALGDPLITEPLVPPVGAFDYRLGQPYAIHVRHPRGSWLIQGSAGYRPGGLEGFEADVVFLGVGGLGTQTPEYRETYWRETVPPTGARQVIPIHWDTLTGPIEGEFTGEVRAAGFLSSGTELTRAFLEEKLEADPGLRMTTLPRYGEVVLFPGTSPSAFFTAAANASTRTPFERTEEREPCADYDPLRRPMFGDLHVHTSYSFDSYISSQRNDPVDAYRYARGEAITLPDEDGAPTIEARIQRPLDFTSVTDHSEFLGPIDVCTQDAGRLGYWWPHCIMTRASHYWTQLLAASWWTSLLGISADGISESFACTLSDCDDAAADAWQRIQQATEEAYDRSAACRFTTFVGYEYTDAPNAFNMHRNVIFRNDRVPERPVSTYDTGTYNFPVLWELLQERCLDAGTGCDVMAIPHNSNLSGGLMFRDPETPREASDRLRFEPVVELTQHKGASECRFDRVQGRGVLTEDELCDFEQVVADNLTMLGSVHGEVMAETAAPVPLDEFAGRNMVRNALKDGLKLGQETGTNPFRMGFIGSTDTHSATPGGAEEDNYVGHLGRRDAGYRNVQDHFFSNPGGHAVVWAEENSRDSIFEAIRRKETYATSGTRPIVRFFAGEDLDPALCESPDMIERAYVEGVPMGGEIQLSSANAAPRFLVSALKDAGLTAHPGTDLQRLQVIKGWVDAEGETHERVIDVVGDAGNGASVDPNTCEPTGAGFGSLCAVWEDSDFDGDQASFYYLRAIENPTCRWSTLQCQAAGVNPFAEDCSAQAEAATAEAHERGAEGDVFGKCCLDPEQEPFYSPVLQERAWTSPIWVLPPSDI